MALQDGKGTTPPGAATEEQAARYVRGMFDQVAPRYDMLNHILSFQVDKYWRRRTVGKVQHILDRADATVLDLACGTGDLTLALTRAGRARVIGSDFCHPMLTGRRRRMRGCCLRPMRCRCRWLPSPLMW